jgi:hypothetical protein
MGMTLGDIRTFVRSFPDLDETDLPNAVLDPLIREGATKIATRSDHWVFYQLESTLTTVAATESYAFSAIDDTYTFRTVTDLIGENWLLRPRTHVDARKRHISASNAEPRTWSQWGQSIYLWPTPDDEYSITVIGYRQQTDWSANGAGAEPDLPDELHELVAKWALSLAYAQQDDLGAAQQRADEFERQISDIESQFLSDVAAPMILGGGERSYTLGRGEPLFDWEV